LTSNLISKDNEIDASVDTSVENSIDDSHVYTVKTISATEAHAEGVSSTNSASVAEPAISTPKKPRTPRKKKFEITTVDTANVNAGGVDVGHSPQLPEISPVEISPVFSSQNSISELNSAQPGSMWAQRFEKIKSLYRAFRPTEKFIFMIGAIALVLSVFSLLGKINDTYSVELPSHGGTYSEGIVGYARFINPLLGYTDADKDMIALVYSGLLKPNPDGKLVADLAESWNVSDDGLTYTFVLKEGLTFHGGKPLTTDDIEFTIEKARDPLIKSPRAENWTGVVLEKISPKEIKFTLKKPYAPFLENMTLGILPKHIWSHVEYEAFDINTHNREPIGSGPFKIKKAYRDDTGIYERYDLVPFEEYSLGAPYIERLIVRFYKNELDALAAYTNGSIDALGGIAPDEANKLKTKHYSLLNTPLPRVFALFFNQSSAPVLVNREVREALNISVNRLSVIDTILQGWGAMSRGAIPRSLSQDQEIASNSSTLASGDTTALSNTSSTESLRMSEEYIEAGRKILIAKGWKQNQNGIFEKQTKTGTATQTQTLRFSISTSNVPELKRSAEILRDTWTKLGADVKVEIFEPSDLTQKVIRPRKYDSLLFGNVVGRDLDLYPFWHSSQRNDPGLNIALYTNIKADKALETIRTASDESKKLEAYKIFETEIQNDVPAIFLYSPDYIYATSKDIHNLEISNIATPSERFMDIHTWYIETEKVWKVFAK
jgi:peptide/nickel transport system substrate-binding protein